VIGDDPTDDEDATTVHGGDDYDDYEELLPLETDFDGIKCVTSQQVPKSI